MEWFNRSPIRVATHGCPQHLDELVAVSLLRRWVEADGRTVEVAFLSRAEVSSLADSFDVLVDIGQQFDVSRGRFDHHQGGPAVQDRSAAGLVFDALYAADPRYAYLEPIIRQVDAIDVGGVEAAGHDPAAPQGRGLVTIPALLKALGGFRPDPERSRRCLDVIQPLVDSWLAQADGYLQAAELVAQAERVAAGIFLASDVGYGPGLLDHAREQTELEFIGFPAGPQRFHVVAIRSARGDNRIEFPANLPGATFVHPKGFLAVFPDREAARAAMTGWGTETGKAT